MPKIDDDERELWVLNDESLHAEFLFWCDTESISPDSDDSLFDFISTHRFEIDTLIKEALHGRS